MQNKFRKMNDKAKYHLDQLLMEMHITSYAEGYEAGKVVTETWSNAKPVLVKSPNQQRVELIAQAKKFVEEKQNSVVPGAYVFEENTVFAHFYNKNKRVTCVLKGVSSGRKYNVAHSLCLPGDVFNLYIGQAISLARALNIDTPVEFLGAVQPTENVVGMMVEHNRYKQTVLLVKAKEFNSDEEVAVYNSVFATQSTIIDDTNAKYEVSTCKN